MHNKQLGQCSASEESGTQTSMTQVSLSPSNNQPVPGGTHAGAQPRADAGQHPAAGGGTPRCQAAPCGALCVNYLIESSQVSYEAGIAVVPIAQMGNQA